MDIKLKNYLKLHSISYIGHEHEAVFTVEESRKLKQSIPGLHCKCLFLKDENKKFYLVALPAEKRLDTKKLKSLLEIKKLNFGSPEELKEKLNLTPGSVSIFGMINSKDSEVVLLIDKEVWDAEKTGFHPNINTSTLELNHEDLEKYYNSLSGEKSILKL
ncbi:prolyl-tRNA synthetase associated domain-containing protein [Candidatus Pacearchaeota archaeon]|nr:prolyl-tRNA synthetase associated domain-containing protein [Candidatus Pacearchaeota archaeon]